MKTFKFDKNQAQRNEVISYSFHPDLVNASARQLRNHLDILCSHMPKVETPFKNQEGGSSQRIKPEQNIFIQWEKAHSHVHYLLKEKVTLNSHWRMFLVSVASFAAISLTLLYNITSFSNKIETIQSTQERLEVVSKWISSGHSCATSKNFESKADSLRASGGAESPALNKSKQQGPAAGTR